jgi:Skp family chaperone for outer membrane proteins
MRRAGGLAAWAAAALALAATAAAQEAPAPPRAEAVTAPEAAPEAARVPAVPQSPVLTLDEERLFAQSRYGRAALAAIDADQQTLVAENRKLEAALGEEERMLTERRPSLPPAEFRRLADAFDQRVSELRRTQDAKSRDLRARRDAERQRVLEAALPVLGEIVAEAGAVAILSDQAIVLAFDRIDITDIAIARLDALLPAGDE